MSNTISSVTEEIVSKININMNNILSSKDIHKQISEMNKAFSLTRNSLIAYPDLEEVLTENLIKCNKTMSDFYIMAFNPNFKPLTHNEILALRKKLQKKYFDNYSFLTDFITFIRTQISIQDWSKYATIDFKRIRMNRYHTSICQMVKETLNELGIDSKIHYIYLGFDKDSGLKGRLLAHPFNLVKLRDTYFILDLSYQDFFLLKDNMINSLGIKGYPNPLPGIYMLQSKSRMSTAGDLLNCGYIELNEKNYKNYFDGFALSFRNGLYYDNREISYTTDYSSTDYKMFLSRRDSQVKREGIMVLGTQKNSLDHDMDFSDGTNLYQNKSKGLVKTI